MRNSRSVGWTRERLIDALSRQDSKASSHEPPSPFPRRFEGRGAGQVIERILVRQS